MEAKHVPRSNGVEACFRKGGASNTKETFKSFCTRFVRLNGILFTRTRHDAYSFDLFMHYTIKDGYILTFFLHSSFFMIASRPSPKFSLLLALACVSFCLQVKMKSLILGRIFLRMVLPLSELFPLLSSLFTV